MEGRGPFTDLEAKEHDLEKAPASEQSMRECTPPAIGEVQHGSASRLVNAMEAGRDASKRAATSCWHMLAHRVDAYAVQPRESSTIGGLITLLILPATVAYGVMLFYYMLNAPPLESNRIFWTNMEGPYTLTLKCEAATCLISNAYGGGEAACVTMAHKEEKAFEVQWGYSPLDGLSALGRVEEWCEDHAEHLDHEEKTVSDLSPIVSMKSETYMPGTMNGMTSDRDGTFIMFSGVFPGSVSAQYVETHNFTLSGSGRLRKEWFSSQLNLDGSIIDGTTPCIVPQDGGAWKQARIRMAPSWNMIDVQDPMSVSQWFGTASGMYAAFISYGATLVAVLEYGTRRMSASAAKVAP